MVHTRMSNVNGVQMSIDGLWITDGVRMIKDEDKYEWISMSTFEYGWCTDEWLWLRIVLVFCTDGVRMRTVEYGWVRMSLEGVRISTDGVWMSTDDARMSTDGERTSTDENGLVRMNMFENWWVRMV